MLLPRKSCPVPLEQQPLEEYNSLILSDFFSLPAQKFKSYFLFLFLFSVFSVVLVNLLFFPSSFPLLSDLTSFLRICIIADSMVLLLTVRLYFSWSYVSKRLLSATIFYEESGWYDGQIWVKTSDMLMQDRLIAMNISIPLINRIKVSIFVFLAKMFAEAIWISVYSV